MSTRDRKASGVIGGLMILLLLALYGFRFISRIFESISFEVISVFFIFFGLVGIIIFGMYRSSSRLAEVDEPMDDPTTSPVYHEESAPKDFQSKTPMLSCPHCGYENPADADFCIRCGRDLDVTDDVARY
ncbi:MAG: zinc ribbon domain-containing protein [Promethearchaeota archaeon]